MTDLRKYLNTIKNSGDLKIIKKPTSTKFEVAAITAQMDSDKAVFFEKIKNSKFRLVTNLIGTRRRFAIAIGSKESEIHKKVISAIRNAKNPKTVSQGKFMENSSKKISDLPIVTHFEKEPGPFITSSIIYVKNPETGKTKLIIS